MTPCHTLSPFPLCNVRVCDRKWEWGGWGPDGPDGWCCSLLRLPRCWYSSNPRSPHRPVEGWPIASACLAFVLEKVGCVWVASEKESEWDGVSRKEEITQCRYRFRQREREREREKEKVCVRERSDVSFQDTVGEAGTRWSLCLWSLTRSPSYHLVPPSLPHTPPIPSLEHKYSEQDGNISRSFSLQFSTGNESIYYAWDGMRWVAHSGTRQNRNRLAWSRSSLYIKQNWMDD